MNEKKKNEKTEKKIDPLDRIIGLTSVKEEITCYMDFIKNKKKNIKNGVWIYPKAYYWLVHLEQAKHY